MCLSTWNFQPMNVDKITCKKCVLRWTWEGHHISASNPEMFENCIDVTINQSFASVSNTILPAPSVTPTDTPVTSVSVSEEKPSTVVSQSSDDPIIQEKFPNLLPKSSECICDISIDLPIYSQCTADGNYCTCFSGAWSLLAMVQMSCAAGTSCTQIGSQILCI